MLEEEVYSHSSPIWRQDFLAGVSGGQIPIHTGDTHLSTCIIQPEWLVYLPQLKKPIDNMNKNMFLWHLCCFVVISAPPVARPLYYSTSPVPVDTSNCGSVSPARKTASVLEPNPGIKVKPAVTHTLTMCPCYCTSQDLTVNTRVKLVSYSHHVLLWQLQLTLNN